MKKILMALMFVFCVGIAAFAEDNIAVFPFENKTQNDYGLTELAENEMTSLLVNQKRFTVIERKDMDKILKEQHLSNSGIVDIKDALQIGKIKGIRYGVFGEITNASWSEKNIASSAFSVKVVDMETANVMFSKVYNMQQQQDKAADKSAAFATMLKEKFKKEISKDLINAFSIEGSVMDIRGKRIIIDAGRKNGVVRGMEFNVIERQEKTSSRTGEKIVVDNPVALLEVTEVLSDNSSACKLSKGEKLKEGMLVKLVQIDDRYYKAEDIEKLLMARGIKGGDIQISPYIGMGIATNVNDPFGVHNGNGETKNFIAYGANILVFLSSYVGFGFDFYMTDMNSRDSFDKNGGTPDLGYSNYSFKIMGYGLTGRVNLSKSNLRFYIPFGLGFADFKHKARYTDTGYNSNRVEKNESVFCGNVGAGIEWDFTNHWSFGAEARFNLAKTEGHDFSYMMFLAHLGYRFGLF